MRREQIRARVTEEHIAAARRGLDEDPRDRATSCPVARALAAKTGIEWSIGITSGGPTDPKRRHESWEPGPKTMQWISRFDYGDRIEPFTAILTRRW